MEPDGTGLCPQYRPRTIFDGNLNSRSVDVTIAAGQVAVCVFANQKDAQVTINKVTDEASEQLFDFTAAIDSGDPDPFSLAGGESKKLYRNRPRRERGDQRVGPISRASLAVPVSDLCGGESPSYDDTFVQFTVAAGAEAECTYVNHKVPSAVSRSSRQRIPRTAPRSTSRPAVPTVAWCQNQPTSVTRWYRGGHASRWLPTAHPRRRDLTVYPKVGGENFTFTEGSLPRGLESRRRHLSRQRNAGGKP